MPQAQLRRKTTKPQSDWLLPVFVVLVALWFEPLMAAQFVDPGPVVKRYSRIGVNNLYAVSAVHEDKAGFLWLGTKQGLMRFDGDRIKSFEHDPERADTLPNNDVRGLVEDAQGYLWIITRGGLSRFSPVTEQFVHFQTQVDDSSTLDSNQLNAIALAPDQSLWIASSAGLNHFNTVNLTNRRMNGEVGLAAGQHNLQNLIVDLQGGVWFNSQGAGLYHYQPDSGQSRHYQHSPGDPDSLDSNLVGSLLSSNDGQIWVGTTQGLNRLRTDGKTFEHFELPVKAQNRTGSVFVTELHQDSAGRIWVGSYYNGLSVLMPGARQIREINQGLFEPDNFNALYINDIIEDGSGVLWFATARSGLVKLNPDAMAFTHQLGSDDDPSSIHALFVDAQGNTWLGAGDALLQYNQDTNRFEARLSQFGLITGIVDGDNQDLILNVGSKGVFRYEPQTGLVSHYGYTAERSPQLPSNNLHSLAMDRQGKLWVGLFFSDDIASGLFHFDAIKGEYVQVLDGVTVEAILPLEDQVIVGTRRKGLLVMDRNTGEWTDVDANGRDASRVWSVAQDRRGNVWIGTDSAGLGRYDKDNGTLTFVTTEHGLPSNTIRAIVEDDSGHLWLGTVNGIVRYGPQTGKLDVFGQTDGLRVTSIYPEMAAVADNGSILMGNAQGMVHFSPNVLLSPANINTPPGPVLLSDFRLFNKPVALDWADAKSPLNKIIQYTEQLVLSHEQYWFSLAFASTDRRSRGQQRYAWQMNGYMDEWIEADPGSHFATFTSLPSGDYQFRVKTLGIMGQPDGPVRELDIRITPPWWQTWQAYLGYILLLVWLIYAGHLIRVRSLHRRAEALELGVQERTETINQLMSQKERMFANISHEFKTPLTLILSPLESLLKARQVDDIEPKLLMIRRNGQRLLRMVEQLLELSRLDTHPGRSNQLRHYSLGALLETIKLSFEPLLEDKGISWQCQSFDDVVVPSHADAVEVILINLISNAIKYTPKQGRISITVRPVAAGVAIEVADTGVGISLDNQSLVFNRFSRADDEHVESVPGAGIGLALVKELVDSHDGDIQLQSEPGKGSSFTVRLPISTSAQAREQTSGQGALGSMSLNEIEYLRHDSERYEVQAGQPPILEVQSGETLLVIDDNPDMLALVTDTLNSHYRCITASNGEQGLETAIKEVPDLIICDVMMPGIDGFRGHQAAAGAPTDLSYSHGLVDCQRRCGQQA